MERGQYLDIQNKVLQHDKYLYNPDQFSNAVTLSKREFAIDVVANFNSPSVPSGRSQVKSFVKRNQSDLPENHPLVKTLREYDSKQKRSKLAKKEENTEESMGNRKKEKYFVGIDKEGEEEEVEERVQCTEFIGPLQLPINERVLPIPEEFIFKNRLELNNILDIEKFKSYKAGKPNKTLYIKNLHKQVSTLDLARLFCRYYNRDEGSEVEYRLMQSGRMKGQAFVTLKDEITATRALLLCNGYKLYRQPIIIQYGRSNTSN